MSDTTEIKLEIMFRGADADKLLMVFAIAEHYLQTQGNVIDSKFAIIGQPGVIEAFINHFRGLLKARMGK